MRKMIRLESSEIGQAMIKIAVQICWLRDTIKELTLQHISSVICVLDCVRKDKRLMESVLKTISN